MKLNSCSYCEGTANQPTRHPATAAAAISVRAIATDDVAKTIGPTWIQYHVGFYIYALVFVIFDVETVFLYPWALAYGKLGLFALAEMLVFIAILVVGLVYALKKRVLRWW